ncbi:MAG: hypothetical protein K2K68_02265 [Duncaniella sp.]|nr:hypothetical protein [Duncaniella sp.]
MNLFKTDPDNSSKDGFRYELRPSRLSKDLMRVSECLNVTIEKMDLWVKTEPGEYEGKYADYYPQLGLIVLTEDALNDKVLSSKAFQPSIHSLPGGNTVKTQPSSEGGLFEDLEDDLDNSDYVIDTLTEQNSNSILKRYMEENVIGPDLVVKEPGFDNDIATYIFNRLTSAEYHWSLRSLFADPITDVGFHASQSKFRVDELMKFFTGYCHFFSDNYSFSNVENFVIDTPRYVLYFHLDRSGEFSHQLRQINKYLYNKEPDIMPFYDSLDKMAVVPYERRASILTGKPVLMFGWERIEYPEGKFMPLISFLGVYAVTGSDGRGNFLLDLVDTRFDFDVKSHARSLSE